jgi:hypothetical protein
LKASFFSRGGAACFFGTRRRSDYAAYAVVLSFGKGSGSILTRMRGGRSGLFSRRGAETQRFFGTRRHGGRNVFLLQWCKGSFSWRHGVSWRVLLALFEILFF